MMRAGARVGGCIKKEDAWYYTGLLKRLRPGLVIEIGVAAGFSSVVALRAMADWGGRLASYDTSESCYYDKNLPVGFYVTQAYPEGLPRWELHTGKDATDAAKAHSGVTLAFIDGDHRHPQPTADLEALKPAMAPDSWFVLHDINLPSVIDGGPDGAARLFHEWKGEKIRIGRGRDNIGAIRWQAAA
jgi:cephalosporin hydroxylase